MSPSFFLGGGRFPERSAALRGSGIQVSPVDAEAGKGGAFRDSTEAEWRPQGGS